MKWLWLFSASAFLAAAQSDQIRASARDYIPPQVRLVVRSELVPLEVVVRNPHGLSVGGLKQSDFEILDQGKPREIAAFSIETREAAPAAVPAAPSAAAKSPASVPAAAAAPPRATLLFFDDLHVAPAELRRTQGAARRFIRDGLAPGARVAVFAASEGLVLDFTANADALTTAIEKLRSHPRISGNGFQSCPRITPYQAYLIANNLDQSALLAAVQEAQQCEYTDPNDRHRGPINSGPTATDPNTIAVRAQASDTWEQARRDSLNSFAAVDTALAVLARVPGTRVLLLVSTGFLSGLLEEEMDATINRAIHAGIVINALDAKGLWAEPPGRPFGEGHMDGFPLLTFAFELQTIGSRNDAMDAVLAEAASATGGLFFHNSNDLAGGFSQLAAVPETTYLLAFRPDPEDAAGTYHKLKVRLTAHNGYYVQTRPGYFAPSEGPTETKTAPSPLDRQALAADVLTEIPIHLDTRLDQSKPAQPEVALAIHVDVSRLKFVKRNGRHLQKLVFIGALLDDRGNMVAAKEGVVDFALKKETLPRLTASGLNASLSLAAPPGAYRVRVVVEDAYGKMGSLNQTIEVPK